MANLTIRNKSGFNYIENEEFMPYVVKRINGIKYIYKQFRVGSKIITKYIGKLDDIVEFYLQNHKNHPNGSPGGIRTPDLRVQSPPCLAATPPGF